MGDRLVIYWFRLALSVFAAGVLLSGCGTSRAPSNTSSTAAPQAAEDVKKSLRSAAADWRGVPHKWGGASKQGVDCSGLVQSVYRSAFRLSLPRTTEEQVDAGHRIQRSSLQPGDLVFFRHGRKKYHVGIYVADGNFLHASSSEGVTVSPLDRTYWTDRWWQARRVLPTQASNQGASARSSAGSGIGW